MCSLLNQVNGFALPRVNTPGSWVWHFIAHLIIILGGWWMSGIAAPDQAVNTRNTGNTYYRNTLVQVFATAKGNETDWYQIGLNEWLERRYVRIVQINTTPPNGSNR